MAAHLCLGPGPHTRVAPEASSPTTFDGGPQAGHRENSYFSPVWGSTTVRIGRSSLRVLKLCKNKQRNLIWDPSSPKDGPKTKPGTSETHRGPRGNVPVAYVPGTSIWGSVGVLEAAHLQPKKKSPARPEMAPSTRDKPLRCNPATWEGLGGHPYRSSSVS